MPCNQTALECSIRSCSTASQLRGQAIATNSRTRPKSMVPQLSLHRGPRRQQFTPSTDSTAFV